MIELIVEALVAYLIGALAVWADRAPKLGIRGGRIGVWKWPFSIFRLARMYFRREG